MPRLLLLAAGDPYHRHVARLRKARYEVIALDRNPGAEAIAGADAFVLASVSDVPAVIVAARTHCVDAVIAATEAGVRAAAEANRHLGLPGLPVEAAHAATDKAEMRRRWAAAGLRQPRFEIAATYEDAKAIIDRFGCPCVVKPTRAWSSQGVSVVMDETDVEPALAEAFAVHDGPVIIEDFVPGRLLSAEGFVSDHRVDVVLTADVRLQEASRHRVNLALCFPGDFAPRIAAEATTLMQAAARALGLERTPFHCECMVGPHGVDLIEMAARGGGGHIFSLLYEPTTGLAGIVHQARLLLGETLDELPSEPIRGSCYRFLSAPEGVVERIEGLAEVPKMPGVVDFGVAIKPGQSGGIVTHGNARHGHVCTIGSDRAEAVALADAAAERVRFVMRSS